MSKVALNGEKENAVNATISGSTECVYPTSETEKEIFTCDRCGMNFSSESQMNAHKFSKLLLQDES